jgi:DNA-binding NarL/FixJ family response regulator
MTAAKIRWFGKMARLILTLSEDLVRALQDLANWEKRQEIAMAAELVRLALENSQPQRDLLFAFASLTERERELAALVVRGSTYAQISRQMSISMQTVKSHLRNIRRKMGVRSNAELRSALWQILPEVNEAE